jgi:hypothetical protein
MNQTPNMLDDQTVKERNIFVCYQFRNQLRRICMDEENLFILTVLVSAMMLVMMVKAKALCLRN